MVRALTAAVLCAVAVLSCKPETEGRSSLVDGPRILALRRKPGRVIPQG